MLDNIFDLLYYIKGSHNGQNIDLPQYYIINCGECKYTVVVTEWQFIDCRRALYKRFSSNIKENRNIKLE